VIFEWAGTAADIEAFCGYLPMPAARSYVNTALSLVCLCLRHVCWPKHDIGHWIVNKILHFLMTDKRQSLY